jgi:hypothetical protein
VLRCVGGDWSLEFGGVDAWKFGGKFLSIVTGITIS